MHPDGQETISGTTQEAKLVSGRFLSDFFRALERQGIPVAELIGDLPIALGEKGQVRGSVEWSHFADFMRRLEHRVGGELGLESCGELIGELAPAAALSGLAGYASSPYSLFYAASHWALRRAMPGVLVELNRIDDGCLEIQARVAPGLRPCPQIFHFATGGARVLPRLIGLADAVVTASIGEYEAHYRIELPPSQSLFARFKRLFRTIASAGSIVHFLEAQQLELHAQNHALQRAHDALADSERRYRAITDTAVDVLCEVDEEGHIVYVSASIQDLIGYSPEQVASSHYRLWLPRDLHDRIDKTFDVLMSPPSGRAAQELIRLHSHDGGQIAAEMTARTYDTPEGACRIVCILRRVSEGASAPTTELLSQDRNAQDRNAQDRNAQDLNSHDGNVERLRDHLAPVGSGGALQPQSHAVERSLRQLLACLDESVAVGRPAFDAAIGKAAQRMARVVESTLLEAQGTPTRFQWIETRKLIRSLRDEFLARHEGRGVDLSIDLASAPAEIWAEPTLLDTSLTSLLDWAIDAAPPTDRDAPTHTVHLEISAVPSTDGPDLVRLEVAPKHVARRESSSADLAISISTDATEALGGRLVEDEASESSSWRIELPQPLAAETRV